jgi:hypothetical protein
VQRALSFVDGRLIVGQAPVSISGLVAAVLLGTCETRGRRASGLAVVVTSAACIAYNDPAHTGGQPLLHPRCYSRSGG